MEIREHDRQPIIVVSQNALIERGPHVRSTVPDTVQPVERYRPWFLAAAIYNAVWGTAVVLFPKALFEIVSLPPSNYPALFQCIGMMVLAYAPGYWLVWKDPSRYGAFVWVGILGKTMGPVGFLVSAIRGDLPWSFGWLICLNDLPWLPAFALFAREFVRQEQRKPTD